MQVLISSVGNTDPIRDWHDGPLLHIARIYRPGKIILLYSESLFEKKHDRILVALNSIADYDPEIEVVSDLLPDSEIALFDRMFDRISKIISDYSDLPEEEEDTEFLLNLSSGTPQIISSLFALNRINEMNFEAVQVLSHNFGSNEKTPFDSETPIEELIAGNKDNVPCPQDRTRKDDSQKFRQLLGKRQVRQHVHLYDFQAAYSMIAEKKNKSWYSKSKRSEITKILEMYVNAIKYQTPLALEMEEGLKKVLTAYLLIDLSIKRNLVTDVLIKSKSLAEYILEAHIQKNYPGLITKDGNLPKINQVHGEAARVNDYIAEQFRLDLGAKYNPDRPYNPSAVLNLTSFKNVIDCLEPDNSITEKIGVIVGVNALRNKVAHGLEPIDNKNLSAKKLRQIGEALRELLESVYDFKEIEFSFNEQMRDRLGELL